MAAFAGSQSADPAEQSVDDRCIQLNNQGRVEQDEKLRATPNTTSKMCYKLESVVDVFPRLYCFIMLYHVLSPFFFVMKGFTTTYVYDIVYTSTMPW